MTDTHIDNVEIEAQKLFEAAIQADKAGDSNEAIRLYEQSSLLVPTRRAPRVRLAFLLFEQGEWKQAIRVGREIIKLWPQIHEGYGVVGLSYQRLGHLKLAEWFLRQAVLIEETPPLLVLYGSLLRSLERNDEAEKTLLKALQLDPDNDEAHYNLACVYKAKYKLALGESHLKRAIEIDPKYSQDYALLGALLAGQKNRAKEAVGVLQKALDEDPDDVGSILYLAHALTTLREIEAADEQYRRLLELWPDGSRPYWHYGNFLAEGNEYSSEAEHYLRKAVEIDPEDEWANYYLGKYLLFWDEKEEAKRLLRKAAHLGHLKARELLWTEAD